MVLQTARLSVRPFTEQDFPDYFGYVMEPELQLMLGLDGVTDETSAHDTFEWLITNREFLALEKKDTGNVIGHICIHPPYSALESAPGFSEKTGCSLSFALAKAERMQGYMDEALRALVRELFSREKLDYIDCEYTAYNAASHALQEKLGFECWGRELIEDGELRINVLENPD